MQEKIILYIKHTTEQVLQKQEYMRQQQCKEAEVTDRVMKQGDLRELVEKTGMHIQTSEKLTQSLG